MTELERPTGRRLSLDPAGPATVVNATDKHGYIAHPEPVVYVSTHDLPRIVEIAHVLPRSRMAQIDAFVAQLGKERVPLDLGIGEDRKSTRLNSSHVEISYAVFCLKKKKKTKNKNG